MATGGGSSLRQFELEGVQDMGRKPHLLHPQAKLQWKRCADMPVAMARPQTVVIGNRVYVGGSAIDQDDEANDDSFLISQYNHTQDEWSTLPPCPVTRFGIGQLSGELVTVGGQEGDTLTGKVYHLKADHESQTWEEFIPPMPTPRCGLSVVSTPSALIACGGLVVDNTCATVEVYSSESGQWHAASSLPTPILGMSCISIAGSCYILGGGDDEPLKTVLSASIASLVQSTTSPPPQQSASSSRSPPDAVWNTLPDIPLTMSAAATLSGSLLAIGGEEDDEKCSAAVYVFINNSWVRFSSGELPEPLSYTTAITLPSKELLLIGGINSDDEYCNTVLKGSIIV